MGELHNEDRLMAEKRRADREARRADAFERLSNQLEEERDALLAQMDGVADVVEVKGSATRLQAFVKAILEGEAEILSEGTDAAVLRVRVVGSRA